MGENRHYQLSLSKIPVIVEQDAYVALQLTSGQLLIISTENLTLRVIPRSKDPASHFIFMIHWFEKAEINLHRVYGK